MATSTRYNRRAICQMAWLLKSGNICATIGEALSASWRAAKAIALKAELAVKTVKFSFTKKDGSVRLAYGTTRQEVVADYPFVGNSTETNKIVRFFDTEINEWRSTSAERIIKLF